MGLLVATLPSVYEPDDLMFSFHLALAHSLLSSLPSSFHSIHPAYMLLSPAPIYDRLCWPARPSMGRINVHGLFVSNALVPQITSRSTVTKLVDIAGYRVCLGTKIRICKMLFLLSPRPGKILDSHDDRPTAFI